LLTATGQTDEAIENLTEAKQIYQSLEADRKLLAEVYLHLAEAFSKSGDLEAAVISAQKCKKLREHALGQYDVRTVEVYLLLSRLLLIPYQESKRGGVLTTQIKASYTEAISCLEKVFRYLKHTTKRITGNGRSTPSGDHNRSQSSMSQRSNISRMTSASSISRARTGSETASSVVHITGPFLSAPYTPAPQFPKNLLHHLTKRIVRLKLDLLENPKHKECVRTLRQEIANDQMQEGEAFSAADARQVILQMAAVSPSVYLDNILARVQEEDETAIGELAIVLQLTESETVGLSSN
jgi:tetratricopeptide (TPR) repeat protein